MVTATGSRLPDSSDGIDLAAAVKVLWCYKYLVLSVAAACAVISAIVGLRAEPVYRAEVVITEVQNDSMGGAGASLAGQLSGIASMAGVALGGGSNNEAKAVLKSRRLIAEFIQRNNLLPLLMRGSNKRATLWLGVNRFEDRVLQIREEKLAGTTTVSVDAPDPQTAARWANSFVGLANELIRERALHVAESNLAYLNAQLAKTDEIELRRVLYGLLENETKTVMLAKGRAEYAFSIVDPAMEPDVRISPRRTLMVIVGFIIGLFIGGCAAFVWNFARSQRAMSRGS